MKIYIDELTWTTWIPGEQEPKLAKQYILDVLLGEKYIIKEEQKEQEEAVEEAFSLEIIGVEDDFVRIKVKANFTARINGEYVENVENEYNIKKDNELIIESNSCDFGWIYKINLKNS